MLGQAVHLARKYGYELFLAVVSPTFQASFVAVAYCVPQHILLSVGFFAGLWYHLDWR